MALTSKQEKFCLEYIKSGNASEAYRRSYNTAKMKPDSIHRKAYEVMANVKVTAYLQTIQDKAEKSAIKTLEQRQELLSKIMDNVVYDKDGNASFSDALKAVDLLNKIDGVYIQKHQTELSGEVLVKKGLADFYGEAN